MVKPSVAGIALGLVLIGTGAFAQTPTRVRGTIAAVSTDTLTVTTGTGGQAVVKLADPLSVSAYTKVSLADVKPGSNVGIASLPQPDGTLRALEVTLMPEGRKINPVNGAWDLAPSSRMTNGAVGDVISAGSGRTLTVDYGTGQQKIVVPKDAPVVMPAPADRTMLKPGAHVVVFARKADDGTLSAGAVAVGKDGLVPPM